MLATLYPLFKFLRKLIETAHSDYWYTKLKTQTVVTNSVTSDVFYKLTQSSTKISPSKIVFGDSKYIAVDHNNFLKFIEQDSTADIDYISEKRDCNAFADVFKGNVRRIGNFLVGDCFGYCDWVDGYHSFIIFYDTVSGW